MSISREDYLDRKLQAIISELHKQMDELEELQLARPVDFPEVLLRQKLLRQLVNAIQSVDSTYGDGVDCSNECNYSDIRNGECECFNRKQDEIESRCPI